MTKSTEAALETVAIAKLSRDLTEFERRERALQDVEDLAERIFWIAYSCTNPEVRHAGWRCAEQQYLGQALARVDVPLDAFRRLAGGTGSPETAIGAAREAQLEAEAALRRLREHQPREVAR